MPCMSLVFACFCYQIALAAKHSFVPFSPWKKPSASCSASHVESWMTHSFKQTSITGWIDWYILYIYAQTLYHFYYSMFCCFASSHGSGPLFRRQSCYMLEGQESTCTCSAIFCAAPLELGSGLHTSFRLDGDTFIVVMLMFAHLGRVSFPFSSSDSSLGKHVWSAALHASSHHSNVSCQVSRGAPLAIHLSKPLTANCTFWAVFFGFPWKSRSSF